MTNSVLAALIPTTYRQSDLAYRLGLLREYLEFAFFTKQSSVLNPEMIGEFSTAGPHDPADLGFLRNLPPELYAAFNRETFHDVLDQALIEAKALPTVRLTVAVLLTTDAVAMVGQWARQAVDVHALLDFSIDPELGAGCQLLWQDVLRDYSLEQALRTHERELYERIPALFSAKAVA